MSDDWKCPRCKDWMESDIISAGIEVIEKCSRCGFKVKVTSYYGNIEYTATCIDHLWEAVKENRMTFTICQRCGEFKPRED